MLTIRTYDEVQHFMKLGYKYADRLHHEGHFSHYDLGEVMLSGGVRETADDWHAVHGHLKPRKLQGNNNIQPVPPGYVLCPRTI